MRGAKSSRCRDGEKLQPGVVSLEPEQALVAGDRPQADKRHMQSDLICIPRKGACQKICSGNAPSRLSITHSAGPDGQSHLLCIMVSGAHTMWHVRL